MQHNGQHCAVVSVLIVVLDVSGYKFVVFVFTGHTMTHQ